MKKHNFLRPSAYGIGIVGVVYRSCGTVVLGVFGVTRSQSANLTRCLCTLQMNYKANWLITFHYILYKAIHAHTTKYNILQHYIKMIIAVHILLFDDRC